MFGGGGNTGQGKGNAMLPTGPSRNESGAGSSLELRPPKDTSKTTVKSTFTSQPGTKTQKQGKSK